MHITTDELYRNKESGRIHFDDWNVEEHDWEEIELKQGQYLVIKYDMMFVYDNLDEFEDSAEQNSRLSQLRKEQDPVKLLFDLITEFGHGKLYDGICDSYISEDETACENCPFHKVVKLSEDEEYDICDLLDIISVVLAMEEEEKIDI